MELREFRALPHRFRWGGMGGDDCTTFCASWIAERWGFDPAAGFRGTYRTKEGAEAIISLAGGLVSFADKMLLPLGFERTGTPVDGDLGVVTAPSEQDGFTQISAIRFGPLWLMLGPHGPTGRAVPHIAAWRYAL